MKAFELKTTLLLHCWQPDSTLQTMPLLLGLPSHLSSPLPFLLWQKKPAGASHQKVFVRKTSACKDGTLKNQPNKMGITQQFFQTEHTSCTILPTMSPAKFTACTLVYPHPLNKCITIHINKALSTAHSTSFYNNKTMHICIILWCHSHLVCLVFKPWFHPSMHLFSLIKLFVAFHIYA